MDILWSPEDNKCTECGDHSVVRRHTVNGMHYIYCYSCWNDAWDLYRIDQDQWLEDTYFEFEEVSAFVNGSALN